MGGRQLSRLVPDQGTRRAGGAGAAPAARQDRQGSTVDFSIAPPGDTGRLATCGLIAINPPWTLADEFAILLPELAVALSDGGAGRSRVDWLAGESLVTTFPEPRFGLIFMTLASTFRSCGGPAE